MNKRKRNSQYWVYIPPWIVIGAVVIMLPIFTFMAMEHINKQRGQATRLLIQRGDALISSFEAGARTGIGMHWSGFQLQKLLMETAQQPDIDYLIVTDKYGYILADSDPSMIGELYGTNLDLERIAGSKKIEWRQVSNPEGADTFEVFRRFSTSDADFERFHDGIFHNYREGERVEVSSGHIIFVGLNMEPIEKVWLADRSRTIWTAAVLFLVGSFGIISLFLIQNYRMAKTSLSRIKAFSDSLVENMPIGLIATDNDGKVISFNQTAEAIFKRSPGDIIGENADDVLPEVCKDLLIELKSKYGVIEKESDCIVEEGKRVPLDIIATMLEDEEGSFVGYVILFRDMTEIEHLKKEVAKSQRLASLGSLAAGVAHEIRNPLSSIKGFATYFKERYRDNRNDRQTAEIMIQEVERLNRVISQLLDFARPVSIDRKWTSMRTIIQNTLKMIELQAREKNIVIRTDLSPHIDYILIDRDKVEQVLLNLYINAMEAMEKGGNLSLSVSPLDNDIIKIDVADTGIGINQKDLGRIFDLYFTTKPAGTGLGLAIVQKIIDAHDGEIMVKSCPGRGTTVTITLPLLSRDNRDDLPDGIKEEK